MVVVQLAVEKNLVATPQSLNPLIGALGQDLTHAAASRWISGCLPCNVNRFSVYQFIGHGRHRDDSFVSFRSLAVSRKDPFTEFETRQTIQMFRTLALMYHENSVDWINRVERQERSDATVVEFCRQEGVVVERFFFWKRAIHERRGIDLVSTCHEYHDLQVATLRHVFKSLKWKSPQQGLLKLGLSYYQIPDLDGIGPTLAPVVYSSDFGVFTVDLTLFPYTEIVDYWYFPAPLSGYHTTARIDPNGNVEIVRDVSS